MFTIVVRRKILIYTDKQKGNKNNMIRKLYSKYFLFCLVSLIILFSLFEFAISSEAKDSFSKNLPKVKDTTSLSKTKTDKKDLKNDKKVEENKDDPLNDELADDIEGKSDPSKNYKLIAIYLIGNRPRVLLKDLSDPDDPPKEYQAGDFLDEEQTISVSKINFNPTARIELTDLDGISYLLKPQNIEDSMSATSSSSSLSKPTYFSSGKGKIKRSVSSPPSPVKASNAQPPPSSPNPPPSTPAAEQAVKKDEQQNTAPAQSPPATAPPPAQALMAAPDALAPSGTTTLTTGSGASATGSGPGGGYSDPPKQEPSMDSMLDVARPANPFE